MVRERNDDVRQVTIKKYSNRRLYDSTNKKYVTLDDIAELVREGNEVKVIDSQSGTDISKVILIQVILESEKNKQDVLPVSFLHMLIKYGNRVAKDFFENYFLMMSQPYLSAQESFKKNVLTWQEMGWFPPGMNMSPPNFDNLSSSGGDAELPSGEDRNPTVRTREEVELIMQKIKELEKKVESLDKG